MQLNQINLKQLHKDFVHSKTIKIPWRHKIIGYRITSSYILALLFSKPRLFFQIVWQTFLGKLLKIRTKGFRSISLVVHYKCNLNCSHCNISLMEKTGRKRLTIKDYQNLDKQLNKIGFLSYALTGGEPLIYNQLFDLIKALKPEKRFILIQTNGFVLTKRLAKKLVRAKVDLLCISIDAMHSQSATGQSQIDFEKYKQMSIIAKKAKLKVQFSYVITQKGFNDDEFERVINYCLKNRVTLIGNLPIPLGGWQDQKKIVLSKKMSKFVRTLEKNTPYFRTDHKNNISGYGCPAFKEKLYVTPYGDIQGCTFLPFSIGNVKKEKLIEILARRKQLPYFQKYRHQCPPAENKRFINILSKAMKKTKKYPLAFKEIKDLIPK